MANEITKKMAERAKALRGPIEDEMDRSNLLGPGDYKLGHGLNNVTVGPDGMVYSVGRISGRIADDGSQLGTGGTLSLEDVDVEKLRYKGNRIFNPMTKYRPPNLVNYYPITVVTPSPILAGLLKGALGAIIVLLKALKENDQDAG